MGRSSSWHQSAQPASHGRHSLPEPGPWCITAAVPSLYCGIIRDEGARTPFLLYTFPSATPALCVYLVVVLKLGCVHPKNHCVCFFQWLCTLIQIEHKSRTGAGSIYPKIKVSGPNQRCSGNKEEGQESDSFG